MKKEALNNPAEWFKASAPLYAIIFGFWWLTAIVLTPIFWGRNEKINSWRKLGRTLFPTVIIPLVGIYTYSIFTLLFNSLFDFLLRYYSPVSVFWYGFLVFLPFALLFIYLAIPDLRPRMRRNLRLAFTRSFWRKAWRNRKNRLWIIIYIAFFVYVIVEFLWKILHS
ncbi:MAG: hypothetical protein QXI91_07740 [Candidatus Bathyarchaeia archaeon]